MEKDKDIQKSVPEFSNVENKDDFINVFNYFEESNRANRAAFSELLNYTYEYRKKPEK